MILFLTSSLNFEVDFYWSNKLEKNTQRKTLPGCHLEIDTFQAERMDGKTTAELLQVEDFRIVPCEYSKF